MMSGEHLHFSVDNYIFQNLGIVPLTGSFWHYTSQFTIFYYFLEGCNFVAYSDHKHLTFEFTKVLDLCSPPPPPGHITGKAKYVADALSLVPSVTQLHA